MREDAFCGLLDLQKKNHHADYEKTNRATPHISLSLHIVITDDWECQEKSFRLLIWRGRNHHLLSGAMSVFAR